MVAKVFVRDQSRVAGSGRDTPGTLAFRNSTAHCGRTLKQPKLAGITTASPLAKVTGSRPCASTTPQPSSATRICTEVLPERSFSEAEVENTCGSFNSNRSTVKYGAAIIEDRRLLPP